jgi:site-specific DNA recombinase
MIFMIAALYARFSSDNQREESITAQIRRGRDYCEKHGHTIIKEYADEAMTGTNDNRPGFQRMMKDAATGLFETVVVYKVNRVGRNEFEYYKNKTKLSEYGVRIEYSAQNLDDSSEGKLMENQLVGMAAYFSRNLSKEVKKGQRENAYAGKISGGKPLFGYSTDSEKHYIINEYEAKAIRYIFESYASGITYLAIVDHLNALGYKTRLGNKFGKNSIHDLLNNRRYIGTCILGKNVKMANGRRNNHRPDHEGMLVVENACPAIIDKNLFPKVAKKRKKNKRRAGARTARHEYLLSGLIYCGECGAAMHGSTTTNSKGFANKYYRCGNKQRHGSDACLNRYIPADQLEALILRKLNEILTSEDIVDKFVDKISSAYKSLYDTTGDDIAAMTAKQNKLRKSMNNLYTLFEDGTADAFDRERLANVKKDLLLVTADLDSLKSRNLPSISNKQIREYINDRYTKYIHEKSAENIRAILKAFINKIVVNLDTITIQYKLDFHWCDWGESNPRLFA